MLWIGGRGERVADGEQCRLGAIARRDWRTVKRYQFRQLLRLLDFVYAAILAFYVGRLFDTVPDELTEYGGNYFDFAMVGLAVMSVAGLGIGTFNDTITREQTLGTLEVLLVTPTPVPVLLAGSLVLPLALTFIDIALYVGVGIGVFGVGLSWSGVLLSIPLFLLTLASFCVRDRRRQHRGARQARRPAVGSPDPGHGGPQRCAVPVSVFPPVLELWLAASRRTTGSTGCVRRCSAVAAGVTSLPTSPCSPGSSSSSSRCRCGSSSTRWPHRDAPASSATTEPRRRALRRPDRGASPRRRAVVTDRHRGAASRQVAGSGRRRSGTTRIRRRSGASGNEGSNVFINDGPGSIGCTCPAPPACSMRSTALTRRPSTGASVRGAPGRACVRRWG